MKRGFFLVGLMLLLGCADQETPVAVVAQDGIEWLTDFAAASKLAKEKDLQLMVNFSGSDWCKSCKALQTEVFSKKEFQEYALQNFVLCVADFPARINQKKALKVQNRKLKTQYGVEGYPTILILDKDGAELARTSYRPGGAVAYVDHVKSLLNDENGN